MAVRDSLVTVIAVVPAAIPVTTPSAEIVATYAELARRGELNARVSVALASDGTNTPAEFERLMPLTYAAFQANGRVAP